MPDPVITDQTAAELWPAFTISGLTGDEAEFNEKFILLPDLWEGKRRWFYGDTGAFVQVAITDGCWEFAGGEVGTCRETIASGCEFPWQVAAWDSGSPVFTRALARPAVTAQDGAAEATVAATLATNLTGNNNDLSFTSDLPGRLGNSIRIRYVSPGTNNAALGIVVSGRDITVNLATNGSAAITSTAAQVKTALEANLDAAALLTIAHKAGNDGSGVVTAMGYTALSGGAGGLPSPPVTTDVT